MIQKNIHVDLKMPYSIWLLFFGLTAMHIMINGKITTQHKSSPRSWLECESSHLWQCWDAGSRRPRRLKAGQWGFPRRAQSSRPQPSLGCRPTAPPRPNHRWLALDLRRSSREGGPLAGYWLGTNSGLCENRDPKLQLSSCKPEENEKKALYDSLYMLLSVIKMSPIFFKNGCPKY